eukprot:COSAG02_NODE_2745_length_8108_cov_2699.027469_7_plen_60_part_00
MKATVYTGPLCVAQLRLRLCRRLQIIAEGGDSCIGQEEQEQEQEKEQQQQQQEEEERGR